MYRLVGSKFSFFLFSADVWNENENKNTWGFAFCKHKKQSLDEVKVFATSGFSDKTKTFIGEYNNITLNAEQQGKIIEFDKL
jgi:hypothetical protein